MPAREVENHKRRAYFCGTSVGAENIFADRLVARYSPHLRTSVEHIFALALVCAISVAHDTKILLPLEPVAVFVAESRTVYAHARAGMRLSHVNDRKSTGARDDDGNDDDPSNKGGSKRRALSMETAINTAVTATAAATKDARVKGEEVLTESTPLEVDRASERSGAKEHLVHDVKNPKRRRRGRRTPPLSERPKTLSGAIREIRATLVDPTIAKLEFYREKISGAAGQEEGGDTTEP